MKRFFAFVLLVCLLLLGCERYEPIAYNVNKSEELLEYESELAAAAAFEQEQRMTASENTDETTPPEETASIVIRTTEISRKPVKVKGIYLPAAVAASDSMDEIIAEIDRTELNAVVIDIKDDNGRITYQMDTPVVQEAGAVSVVIEDLPALLATLRAHGIYTIARCVAFRDPYIAEVKPEWSLHKADGSVFRDRQGLAWVNPYKQEMWDYLIEIGEACGDAGFDEVQFDYIRFCTERGMDEVVYDEADTQGRDKIGIITEFTAYAKEQLSRKNVFVSADVFGTIIDSYVDANAVGQDYAQMASNVDYICPMIYPSHYADGNFGIEHPDAEPYGTIQGALGLSRNVLEEERESEEAHQAIVRPWLQAFTATYLDNYTTYEDEQIRAQIQAVYDSGYDEWILWNAAGRYSWSAFEAAEAAQ